ncbi:MAG: cysteine hydrolase [Dehalococcoidia bacterium]
MTKPAVVVVDMLKDNIDIDSPYRIGDEGNLIVPNIQGLLKFAREKSIPIIFANDSYLPADFLFKGRMKPHCIQGTRGSEVIDEFGPQKGDIILPKRRMSAFFKTGLEDDLRARNIDTVIVCGISTTACVMTTAMDAFMNDFYVIVAEDCCAARTRSDHESAVQVLRSLHVPLGPLFEIKTLEEIRNLPELQ